MMMKIMIMRLMTMAKKKLNDEDSDDTDNTDDTNEIIMIRILINFEDNGSEEEVVNNNYQSMFQTQKMERMLKMMKNIVIFKK